MVAASEDSSGREQTPREGLPSPWIDLEVAREVGLYVDEDGLWKLTLKKM